MNFTLTSPGT